MATIRRREPTCTPPTRRESDFFSVENAVSCRSGLFTAAAEELVDGGAEIVGVERLALRCHSEVDRGQLGSLDMEVQHPLGGLHRLRGEGGDLVGGRQGGG